MSIRKGFYNVRFWKNLIFLKLRFKFSYFQTETFPCHSNNTNLMGPLSTSDENTASEADSSSSTTAESFIQQRLRHTSMPQPRVSSTSGLGGNKLTTTKDVLRNVSFPDGAIQRINFFLSTSWFITISWFWEKVDSQNCLIQKRHSLMSH